MKLKGQFTIIIFVMLASAIISSYSLIKVKHYESRINQAESRMREYKGEVDFLRLAKIVEHSISNLGENNFQKAVNIRNHIYRNVPLKQTPKKFKFMNTAESYLESLRNEEVGHICGGLVATYLTALESQGIPARYVGYFSKDNEPSDNHTTVEFWYNGKWYASDPTFNIMFMHNGEYLSYSELYALIMKQTSYEVVSNEYPILPNRALKDYYIKLDDLMKFMIIHPSEVWSDGKHFQYPIQLFPDNWDGAITYNDGVRRDVRNFGEFYKYLKKGPLR